MQTLFFALTGFFSVLSSIMQAAIEKDPAYPISSTPQLPLEVYSNEFAQILGAKPELVPIANGFGFTILK